MKVSGATKLKTGEATARSAQAEARGSSVTGVSGIQNTFAEVAENMELQAIISELDAIGAAMSRYPAGTLLQRYKELVRHTLARVKNGTRITLQGIGASYAGEGKERYAHQEGVQVAKDRAVDVHGDRTRRGSSGRDRTTGIRAYART